MKNFFPRILCFICVILLLTGCMNHQDLKDQSRNETSSNALVSDNSISDTSVIQSKSNSVACNHIFDNASCTIAKRCTICGKTEGTPLGHNWNTATCTAPKKCSLCNQTEGSALGHNFKGATCATGGICTRCNTSGQALSHSWKAATCTAPKKCSRCGETSGAALGHTTNNGTCSRCKKTFTKVYGIGETWVVADQWEFTIDSVTTHTMCNRFADTNDLPQCVIITYSYKNLGYIGSIQDLYISGMSFDVYDSTGEAAETYPCTHTKSPKVCAVGTKCSGAQEAYALYNNSSEITLNIEQYTSDTIENKKATFKLKVN